MHFGLDTVWLGLGKILVCIKVVIIITLRRKAQQKRTSQGLLGRLRPQQKMFIQKMKGVLHQSHFNYSGFKIQNNLWSIAEVTTKKFQIEGMSIKILLDPSSNGLRLVLIVPFFVLFLLPSAGLNMQQLQTTRCYP